MQTFILAAGKGTRMKRNDCPKALLEVSGQLVVFNTINRLQKAGLKDITMIVGYKADQVIKVIKQKYSQIKRVRKNTVAQGLGLDYVGTSFKKENTESYSFSSPKFFKQKKVTGTGQAVKELLENEEINLDENFVVINGDDLIFYTEQDIQNTIDKHLAGKYKVSMFVVNDDGNGNRRKMIFDKDFKFQYLSQKPMNKGYTLSGFYVLNKNYIKSFLVKEQKRIKDKPGEELKLTNFLFEPEAKTNFYYYLVDRNKWFGINTPEELGRAREAYEDLNK